MCRTGHRLHSIKRPRFDNMKEKDFPTLEKDITYLDSACMTLRPEPVIEAVGKYYRELSSCPGRSSHSLAQKTTEKIEESRKKVARLIDAQKKDITFTSGTTESINTVTRGFKRNKAIISDKEHNSNILPWQDDDIEVIPTEKEFNLELLESKVEQGDLVSITHKSNLDGSKLPVREISKITKEKNAYLLVDSAQSIGHQEVSVKELKPDFMAFSGHKMLGPSGTGVLYVADRVKDDLKPLKKGGGAVNSTTFNSSEPKEFPHNMEAGLPNAAGTIGLKPAVEYLTDYGVEEVAGKEKELSKHFYKKIEELESVRNVGTREDGVFSIKIEGVSAHQAALMLDRKDIMVRAGKHCVHPWFEKYDEQPTLRASLHLYNDKEDIDKLIEELEKIAKLKG